MNYENIFILLIVFQAKHLIADYYLQFPYMYMNKGADKNWFKPLFDHASIHALMTLVIIAIYCLLAYPDANKYQIATTIGFVTVFDFITHFITDRWKAVKKDRPDESKFWYSLGIDQMVHHIVGIIIVFFVYIWNS
jgi:hypothetical protein